MSPKLIEHYKDVLRSGVAGRGERSASQPGRFAPGVQCTGRLGGHQKLSGRWGGENVFVLPVIEPSFLGRLACSVVTVPTEPFRLEYAGLGICIKFWWEKHLKSGTSGNQVVSSSRLYALH